MFGLFKKKKKDAKPADKTAGKGKDAAVKQAAPKAAKSIAPADKKPAQKSDPEQDALKAAIAILEGDPAAALPPPKPLSAGINLDKAKEALAKKGAAPMDRKALIEQALAIQQTQAKMLDKLPDATRQKLRALAIKTFGTDEPKSSDQKKKMN